MDTSARPVDGERLSRRSSTVVIAEIAIATIGIAFLLCAGLANQHWLDSHFLPSFFLPHGWWVLIESCVRVMLAAAGSLLLWVRPRLGRRIASSPALVVSSLIAAVLGLAAGELALRHLAFRPLGWLVPEAEPRRHSDPRLGWTVVPERTGHSTIGGRVIDYSFDRAGYRVRREDVPVDREQPAILFAGESIMFGEGLTWEESIPAQVGAIAGIQSANLAVHGFSTDQAYLRLETELPRFRRPVAVAMFFMTALFGRNLDDNRPHLGPGLTWYPAVSHGRLTSLLRLVAPFRKADTVERGVVMTRQVLTATVTLARARGAQTLIVVPQFGAESDAERELRRRILDETRLPYVWIQLDDGWRLSGNLHPTPSAAHTIAVAVAGRFHR